MSFYKDRLSKYSDLLCKNRKSYKNNFPSCSLCLPLFHSRFARVCMCVCECVCVCVCVCVMFPPFSDINRTAIRNR